MNCIYFLKASNASEYWFDGSYENIVVIAKDVDEAKFLGSRYTVYKTLNNYPVNFWVENNNECICELIGSSDLHSQVITGSYVPYNDSLDD